MAWTDFLKPLAAVAGVICPPVGAAIAAINMVLPEDKKLPETATGQDVADAYEAMPPGDQVEVQRIHAKVEMNASNNEAVKFTAICEAEGQQTTRPRIAVMMAQTLCFEILGFTVWAFIYPEQMTNPALWTVFATLTGVPASVLAKYFGELRKEQGQRLQTVGMPAGGLIGQLTSLFKK